MILCGLFLVLPVLADSYYQKYDELYIQSGVSPYSSTNISLLRNTTITGSGTSYTQGIDLSDNQGAACALIVDLNPADVDPSSGVTIKQEC